MRGIREFIQPRSFSGRKLAGISFFFAISVLVAFFLAASARAGVNNWTTNGPSGSHVNSVAVSPDFAVDNTVFAGTIYGGGIYKSTDGGASWTQYAGGLSADSLGVSPTFASDGTVFAGLASGGVSKSTDGGSTWNYADNGLPGEVLGSDVFGLTVSPNFATDHTVFAGSWGYGVCESADGGASWNVYDNGLADNTWVDSMAVSPTYGSDHTVFAGVYPNAGNTGGVFKSEDGGASWSEYNDNLPDTSVDSVAVSPAFSSDHTVFAGTDYGVYKSIDGGSHWTSTLSTPGSVWSLGVSPNFATDGTVLASIYTYGSGGGGVYKSTDGGSSWTEINSGLTNTDVLSVAVSPAYASSTTISFAGTDGGGVFSNTSPCSPCSGVKPDLTLSSPHSFWASPSDYNAGILSVTWTLNNDGANEAWSVQLTSSANTNGVTLASTLPAGVGSGNILPGASGSVTLKYNVPAGLGSWRSALKGSAQDGVGNTYSYP